LSTLNVNSNEKNGGFERKKDKALLFQCELKGFDNISGFV
jgi:hypothetical protein